MLEYSSYSFLFLSAEASKNGKYSAEIAKENSRMSTHHASRINDIRGEMNLPETDGFVMGVFNRRVIAASIKVARGRFFAISWKTKRMVSNFPMMLQLWKWGIQCKERDKNPLEWYRKGQNDQDILFHQRNSRIRKCTAHKGVRQGGFTHSTKSQDSNLAMHQRGVIFIRHF